MFSGLGDITGESAASSRPSHLGGFALSLPTCFQYPSAVTHFLACAWARFCMGLDRAAGRKGRKDGKGDGGGRGWNKSEPDARTRVIERLETGRDQRFPARVLISQKLSTMYSYCVSPRWRSAYHRTAVPMKA